MSVGVALAVAVGGCARMGLRNLEEVEGWPRELGASAQRRGLRRKQQEEPHKAHRVDFRWRLRNYFRILVYRIPNRICSSPYGVAS